MASEASPSPMPPKENGEMVEGTVATQPSTNPEAMQTSLPNLAVVSTETAKPQETLEPSNQPAVVMNGSSVEPPVAQKLPSEAPKKSSERDSVNALLSLGRDLTAESDKGSDDGTAAGGGKVTTPDLQLHTLPAADDLRPPPAKRVKPENEPDVPAPPDGASDIAPKVGNDGSYQYPPDFWYWLPSGETIGDWDVLCGRGGESNNFIGNKKYRKVVNERKEAYRQIPLKQRKAKTTFVRGIVQHVNNCGGRFVDLDEKTGNYYVVTMEKARKKTSQALRETKVLKWLEIDPNKERKAAMSKNIVCPYCNLPGHKTKIAKACLRHHEWLDPNTAYPNVDELTGAEKAEANNDTPLEGLANHAQGPVPIAPNAPGVDSSLQYPQSNMVDASQLPASIAISTSPPQPLVPGHPPADNTAVHVPNEYQQEGNKGENVTDYIPI
eukprot:Nitzschia sp. Nitz4//scaffold6_size259037//200548//201864//NITZ4_001107-RA/size259037-processed-gene-0.89-mRNA-1//-1//CDS//3329556992//7770//frame0